MAAACLQTAAMPPPLRPETDRSSYTNQPPTWQPHAFRQLLCHTLCAQKQIGSLPGMHFVSSLPLHLPLHLQPSGKHFRLLLGLSRARPQKPKKPGNAQTRSLPTQANHDMTSTFVMAGKTIHFDPGPPVPRPVNGGRRCRACGAFRRPPLAV